MNINKDRLVNTFLDLVQIDSESGNEQQIIEHLNKQMQDFGFETQIDATGNLICSNSKDPKFMLSAHVDTVSPGKNVKPIVEGNIISSDGTTVLGSDDKANVALILEIINTFKDQNFQAPLEVVFLVSEEIGLIGSKNLDYSKIKSKVGLNLDVDTGNVCLGEASMSKIEVNITGKAAHSGVAPEKGINAIKIAAEAIANLDFGKLDENTTSNVGIIQGGTAVNTVPDQVKVKLEVRSHIEESFKQGIDKIKNEFEKAAKKYGGKVDIKPEQTSVAYHISEKDPLVQVIKKSLENNNIEANLLKILAATDANNFSQKGIRSISTGVFGKKFHTTEEYLEIDKFIAGSNAILQAIEEYTRSLYL